MIRIIFVSVKIVALSILIGLIYILHTTEFPPVIKDAGIIVAGLIAAWLTYGIIYNMIRYRRDRKSS